MCADLYLNFSDVIWTYKKTHAEKREFFILCCLKSRERGEICGFTSDKSIKDKKPRPARISLAGRGNIKGENDDGKISRRAKPSSGRKTCDYQCLFPSGRGSGIP